MEKFFREEVNRAMFLHSYNQLKPLIDEKQDEKLS